jgi:hypothetical protein
MTSNYKYGPEYGKTLLDVAKFKSVKESDGDRASKLDVLVE